MLYKTLLRNWQAMLIGGSTCILLSILAASVML